jgi:hypothetical protein
MKLHRTVIIWDEEDLRQAYEDYTGKKAPSDIYSPSVSIDFAHFRNSFSRGIKMAVLDFRLGLDKNLEIQFGGRGSAIK